MSEPVSAIARDQLTRPDRPSNARDVVMHADPRAAGAPESDEIYAVVSVLYHALQGAAAYERYIGDAQKAGDPELERFFRACRNEEHARARRARVLLAARLGADGSAGSISASSDEVEAISDGG